MVEDIGTEEASMLMEGRAEDVEGDDLRGACGVVVQSCCQGIIATRRQ